MKNFFLVVLCYGWASLWAAGAGSLDTTFGRGKGYVITNTESSYSQWEGALGVAVQSDGKIVAVGSATADSHNNFAILRYKSSGDLDTTFGDNGIKKVAIGASDSLAHDVVIQPDGKIVAVGLYAVGFDGSRPCVVRLLADGSLDTDFNGTGIVQLTWLTDTAWGWGLARQDDGALVVSGFVEVAGNDRLMLARITSAGVRDTTFNAAGAIPGVVTTAIYTKSAAADVAIQSDGKIVAVGGAGVSSVGENFVVARYNSDGTPDLAFNQTGVKTTAIPLTGYRGFPYTVLLQPDDKIVIAGSMGVSGQKGYLFAMRYQADGQVDTSFGVRGLAKKILDYEVSDFDGVGLLQADGKIVVGGYQVYGETTATIVLTRFTKNGKSDVLFGTNGRVVTDIGVGIGEIVLSLARQPNGKLIAGGGILRSIARTDNTADFLILRYLNMPGSASASQIRAASQLASNIGLDGSYVNTAAKFYNLLVQKGDDFQNQSSGGVRCR